MACPQIRNRSPVSCFTFQLIPGAAVDSINLAVHLYNRLVPGDNICHQVDPQDAT